MAALLTIVLLILFVAIDHAWSRRASKTWGAEQPLDPEPFPRPSDSGAIVGGYELRPGLRYHQGHTWARLDERGLVTVGVDDFARRLIGRVEQIELPCGGSALLQGEVGFRVGRDDRWAGLLSPIDGEVMEVNRALLAAPSDISTDPYGRGWICRVRPRNTALSLRNLLGGTLARRWLEEEGAQLSASLARDAGGAMADGGLPAADFERHLPDAAWNRLADRFLLRAEPGESHEDSNEQ